MKRVAALSAGAVGIFFFLPVAGFCGDAAIPAPLTFNATRSGKTSYSLNWGMRLADAVPVKTGVSVGLAAAPDGRVSDVPLHVTAGIGDIDSATAAIRRSIEVAVGQNSGSGDALVTMRRARPLAIAPGLDAELRQSVTTGLRAGPSRAEGLLQASQTLLMNDVVPRTSLQATTVLSSTQTGVSTQFRIERKLLKHLSVSADFTHDATTSNARVDARYSLTW